MSVTKENGEVSLAEQVALLSKKLERLDVVEKELQRLKDIEEIKQLMNKFGYYMDKQLFHQIVHLYADRDDIKAHCHGGVWVGREGVKRLYHEYFGGMFTGGKNGPAFGWMVDHVMAQYVITVAEDGLSAKGRSRTLMQCGSHDEAVKDDPDPMARETAFRAWWEGALYENEFVKENGKWRLKTLGYRPMWHSAYDRGWDQTPVEWIPFYRGPKFPDAPGAPDEVEEPGADSLWMWPDSNPPTCTELTVAHVLPFHYPDESGKWLADEERIAPRLPLKKYPTKKDW